MFYENKSDSKLSLLKPLANDIDIDEKFVKYFLIYLFVFKKTCLNLFRLLINNYLVYYIIKICNTIILLIHRKQYFFSNLLIPNGFKMATTHLAKYSVKLHKCQIAHYYFDESTKWLSIDFGEAPEVNSI